MKHRHKLQERHRRTTSKSRRSEVQEELHEQPATGRAKRSVRHELRAEGQRPRVRLDKYSRGSRRPQRYDDGGTIADASPIAAPNLAFGSGPPPPPRVSDDGTPISAAPPRANNPGFLNALSASQKRAAMAQRVKKLEGKGR